MEGFEAVNEHEGERKCPTCAEWINRRATVCRHCGWGKAEAAANPPARRGMGLLGGMGFAVFALVGGVVVISIASAAINTVRDRAEKAAAKEEADRKAAEAAEWRRLHPPPPPPPPETPEQKKAREHEEHMERVRASMRRKVGGG